MKFSFSFFLAAVLFVLPTLLFAQAPANDECGGAIAVSSMPFSYSQDTRLATVNATDPNLPCADGGGGKTVWFTFTPDSTRFYSISSRNSTPTTYDVAFGLFTGTCGSLSLVDCNDDIIPGTIRQAEIGGILDSGVTYIIHVAEWAGGGPNGGIPTGGDLVFEVYPDSPKPLYQGPRAGSVALGATISTGMFMNIKPNENEGWKEIKNPIYPELIQTKKGTVRPKGKAGSNLQKVETMGANSVSQPVVLDNFQGMTPSGAIPPDPICAVGPNHVITMVNSNFRIYDKNGTMLHHIALDTWFSNVRNPVGFSDPQVFYDHFANRWVMAGGGFAEPYSLLISVSDDDDPTGTWYNWNLPAGLGDSVTGNLPDYPQVGFDADAVYITSNEFNPGLLYSRVRIIEKSQLYTGTAGAVSWFDVWDFREPDHRNVPLTSIRPSIQFGQPNVHFMVNTAPYNPGTFFTVWTIANPATAPTLTAENVPIVEYYSSGNADQLGGTGTLLEAGGSAIRHKTVYRDSSLWMAHSIAYDSGSSYSSVRYVRLNPFTSTSLEDVALGMPSYWHYYPSLMVDAFKNVVITYTRSSVFDYPGMYVSGRKDSDPPGLAPSVVVKAGEGHYELVGGGRNRWGDYSGAGLDPVDTAAIWVNGEYALSSNNWATWVGKIKLAPVEGKYIYGTPSALNFGTHEIGTQSDTLEVMLRNFGIDAVDFSGITLPNGQFQAVNLPEFPYSIVSGDSFILKLKFVPADTGTITTTLDILSNDVDRSPISVNLTAVGFNIIPVSTGTMYTTSGSSDGGRLFTIDESNGTTTLIGNSDYQQVVSLRVHPTTNELIGLIPVGTTHLFVRVNSEAGDAHPISTINLPTLKGMEFINDSTLYVGRINGKLYSVNLYTGAATEIASTGIIIAGLAINPVDGQLWASERSFSNPDRIYKISMPSGTKTLVGATGFNQQTQDIIFDGNGNLYGITGYSAQTNRLIVIDKQTGAGTELGSTGRTNLQSLAFANGTSFDLTTYSLRPSWNMLSVPVTVPDASIDSVFPTHSSSAFSYDGKYSGQTSLENGKGYWVKFNASKFHLLKGTYRGVDSISVRAKWNMIGSVSQSIPTSAVFPIPPVDILSSFTWYNPDSGYQVATTIDPGKAYWVKTDEAGEMILNYTTASKNIVQRNDVDVLKNLNELVIKDKANHSQSLYFGQHENGISAERYEMPPPPPSGTFDARFGANNMIALHSSSASSETFPIQIEANAYPVMLRWNVDENVKVRYSIETSDEDGQNNRSVTMKGNGSMTISSATTNVRLHISENVLPTEFALKQNYPNPFNPSTFISYDLPVDASVRLTVFDVLGKEVASIVNQEQEAGAYDVSFNAMSLASGVYFYQLTAEPLDASSGKSRFQDIQKMLLMK